MRRMSTVLLGIGVVVTLASLLALRTPSVEAIDRETLSAARQAAQQLNLPTIRVYSRETVVDVTITDAKGNPVHGLTRDDFTVKEDGKPQAIKSFEEFGSSAPDTIHPPPKLPPNVYTNLQPPQPTSALNVILLDFVNTAPVLGSECCEIIPCPFPKPKCVSDSAGPIDLAHAIAAQHAVKQSAMKYLEHISPGTRVSVIGMRWPASLRVLQGFTSDPALLSAAVNTLDSDTNASVGYGSLDQIYEQYCTQQDGRDRMTVEVLQQVAADLAGVKGRKNLIWFTVGTPYVTDPGARPECIPDYSTSLTRAYSLLTAAQVALYPVDARGLVTAPDAFVSLSGQLMIGPAITPFLQKTDAEHLALESYAEATGGEAFYNTNDLGAALSEAFDKGANYYTLSYVPPSTAYDGRYHTIKVSVDQPGLHLVYRNGYAAEDPAKMAIPPGLTLATAPSSSGPGSSPVDMRQAMGRAMPTSAQILFDVQVEPSTEPAKPGDPPILGALDPVVYAKLKGKPPSRYGFEYVLPARQISFTNTPEGDRKASLEFDLAVYDASGKLVTSLSQSIKPVITADQYQQLMKGPFRFFQQLDLPLGQFFVRIGVLDRTSNKVGTLEIPLTVAKSTSLATNTK